MGLPSSCASSAEMARAENRYEEDRKQGSFLSREEEGLKQRIQESRFEK
jgi:hypothetical protein